MPPAKRARKNAAAAYPPSWNNNGRWLSLRTSKRLKRSPLGDQDDDDDGLPFSDEILLTIFACSALSLADLVRCAATCRRWLRLVWTEADFICRSSEDHGHAAVLAVGFFHQSPACETNCSAPRFIPLPLTTLRLPGASLDALFDGEVFTGFLLLELRPGSRGASLRLAVVNPMMGDVRILPTLSNKDKPGFYACAILTADDLSSNAANPLLRSRSAFLVIIIYRRNKFAACRFYSSETGAWAPECKVTGATLSGARLNQLYMNAAAVAIGGSVFWQANQAVVSLCVNTLEARLQFLPMNRGWITEERRIVNNCLITASSDGKLGLVEAWVHRRNSANWNKIEVRVLVPDQDDCSGRRWKEAEDMMLVLEPYVLRHPLSVYLLGVCEKSRVIFCCLLRWRSIEVYVLARHGEEEGTTDPWGCPGRHPLGVPQFARELPRSHLRMALCGPAKAHEEEYKGKRDHRDGGASLP
ncbi:hypothetical protein EJB05_33486, partial [Eragrostis curvula]